MNTPAHLQRPTIPIAYLQLLLEILAERGFSSAQLFEDLPVPTTLLTAPRMSALQWTRLVLRARELTQDPGLGYEYGLRMRPTAHGLLGYAAMSAGTVREAIDMVVRYAGARQAHFTLSFEVHDEYCQLVLRERFPIPVLRTFFYENILLGLTRGSAFLLGRELEDFTDCEICFDTPEPPYYREWRDRLQQLRFNQGVNAVRFPPHYLDLRPALADPHASQQARALCERELALAAKDDDDLSARVLAELRRSDDEVGYPSLEEVAARLFISTRTLKRRLHEQSTSFLRLLNETRKNDACELLTRTDLSVQAIATRLGYENPANFSRAFAQAIGKPPSVYRAQVREARRGLL
ncbi:MAG TPA: AraC family transcriptional regulator ligand-binding domain-containing protein [Polyangiaceae bacterium]|nr:AraC family transcriptional regulator ligand-binding domain-containing protein [Polyangiaceae bacterium]